MTCGEDETVAVEPLGGFWIETQAAGTVEHGSDFGAAKRQAKVTGRAGVDGVHGEATSLIGGLRKNFSIHSRRKLSDRARRVGTNWPLASRLSQGKPGCRSSTP